MHFDFHSLLRRAAWFAPIALLAQGACTLPATEVLVVVDTNAPVGRTLELTASVAAGSSAMPMQHTWTRGPDTPGSVELPASFAVVPAAAAQQDAVVTLALHLRVAAGRNGEPAVDFERTARFGFIRHQTAEIRIYLPLECGAASHGCTTVADAQCTVAQHCEESRQTCNNEANCASPDVTPVPLVQGDASVITSMHPDITRVDVPITMDSAPPDARDSAAMDVPVDVARDVPARDACPGAGSCTPGATRTVSCGNCGMETDTCSAMCAWVAGACMGSGACTPGATRSSACGNCGTRTDTCSAMCAWTTGTCTGSGPCSPGATRQVSCGPCATETDTCSATCAWVAGTCSGSCCTPTAGCAFGNPIGGVCTGNGDDGCGGACTCDAVNGEACNTGSGVGSCCHTSGWFCGDVSQCCPGLNCVGNICR